jgi:hypothetical protein
MTDEQLRETESTGRRVQTCCRLRDYDKGAVNTGGLKMAREEGDDLWPAKANSASPYPRNVDFGQRHLSSSD